MVEDGLEYKQQRSSSVCLALVGKEDKNNPVTLEQIRKKSVKFPAVNDLVTKAIEPENPWLNRRRLSPQELISTYKLRCDTSKIQPLYSVILQLESIDLTQSLARRPLFDLKGCQLNEGHIDMLENVFRHVQFKYLNLENTNLDDESIESLCDIVSHYETCTELCLARNPHVTPNGWRLAAILFRRMAGLQWLDLRGNNLDLRCVQDLSGSLRGFPTEGTTRRIVKKQHYIYCYSQPAGSCKSRGRGLLEVNRHSSCSDPFYSFRKTPSASSSFSSPRGLHLGNTGVNGELLQSLAPGLRLGCITDLRLPNNGITGGDAKFLVPLLRYSVHLKYLDLSANFLGDLGCLIISEALATPCYSSENCNLNRKFGLIRLFLSENRITSSSMSTLARGLTRCTRLTTLQLCGNTNIGSIGLRALKSGLINSPRLKRLGIAFCGIDNQGALHISEILTKTKSRFTLIDLTGNLIDSEGSLTIAKCSTYLNEEVKIKGLEELQISSLMQCALEASKKENGGDNVDSQTNNSQVQDAVTNLLQSTERFLPANNNNNNNTNNKHKNSLISSIKLGSYRKTKFHSAPGFQYTNKSFLDCDPRYLWGDSSDNDTDDDNSNNNNNNDNNNNNADNDANDNSDDDDTVNTNPNTLYRRRKKINASGTNKCIRKHSVI
ncbi:unnamed protein product [Trichobilharzia szidati]|nr:unnamed protein product [Trichobilharzia szidati]CAH8833678.1 unnamed protein product [Trichobilharzia szidati]